MCLENANEQLDNKQVEFGHLKSVVEKLEINEKVLTDQLENAHIQYQECKRKYETTKRLLEEKTAKDEILADEIKVFFLNSEIRKTSTLILVVYFLVILFGNVVDFKLSFTPKNT